MVTRRVRFLARWRRAGMGLRVLVLGVGALLFGALIYVQRPHDEAGSLFSNLSVILLVNALIVVLCVLGFLVSRNVAKLVLDRRRRILGSKLRLRLVVAFVGLTLVPTILLFVLASDLLNQAMEGWFSTQVESSISGAVDAGRVHFTWLRDRARSQADRLLREMSRLESGDATALHDLFERYRTEQDIFSIRVVNGAGAIVYEAAHPTSSLETFAEPEPDKTAIARACSTGKSEEVLVERDSRQFVRIYEPLRCDEDRQALVVSLRVFPELAEALSQIREARTEYEQVKFFRQPLRLGYLLTLAMITLLILFGAIWVAFHLARQLVIPIQRLAEGTQSIARGNYDFQLKVSGDDEISYLVSSFNKMTADLRQSRRDSERRQLFIETILANLGVGVIGLDREQRITAVNSPAQQLFALPAEQSIVGRPLGEILDPENWRLITPLLEAIEEREDDPQLAADVSELELKISHQGRELRVVATAGRIVSETGKWFGTVILLDDITELAHAQHMSAWREVAQRIAHEIKNPLTPIQLSAQRLEKLLARTELSAAVRESTQTIVESVDSIKRLANEFSHFARMPTARYEPANLNDLIAGLVAPYAADHPNLSFELIADPKVPIFPFDREQIRRAFINLLENANAACLSDSALEDGGGRIVITTTFDKGRRTVLIEVADNGPGISSAIKARIFEPYFTTKSSGTGLGLAIVSSIISDHQGAVRVYDNQPRGARFVVELPITQRPVTPRRFA